MLALRHETRLSEIGVKLRGFAGGEASPHPTTTFLTLPSPDPPAPAASSRRCGRLAFAYSRRPPQASVFKNAGLAYLNLVRSPHQPGGFGDEKDGLLVTPLDPFGAASLLPWDTDPFVADMEHRPQTETHALLDGDEHGGGCPALSGGKTGGDAGGKLTAVPRVSEAAAAAETSENGGLAMTASRTGRSRAVGSWRSEASARFMHMWKQFLDHENATLDKQYGTVRDIYRQLVGRLGGGGGGAQTGGRGLQKKYIGGSRSSRMKFKVTFAGTTGADITYKRGGFKLTAFSDSNWGNNPDNGKPTSSCMLKGCMWRCVVAMTAGLLSDGRW